MKKSPFFLPLALLLSGILMHTISCNSHFVVMDTEKEEKKNIICVHSN